MNISNQKILFEVLWIAITIVVVVLCLLPIYTTIGLNFPYYTSNIINIVLFITITRWIFFLRHSFFAKIRWIKVAMIFLPILFYFFLTNELYAFQRNLDETGLLEMMQNLDYEEQRSLFRYIRFEYVFFGVAALIVLFMLPIRMIISIWRVINLGKI